MKDNMCFFYDARSCSVVNGKSAPNFRKRRRDQYQCLNLLFQDEAEGLEIYTSWGEWIAVSPVPETMLVNTGDLMQLWTNDRFRFTKHRVAVPADFTSAKERYSIVCFAAPNYDAEIACIPACCDADYLTKYEPVVVGDYYMQKLQETYNENLKVEPN